MRPRLLSLLPREALSEGRSAYWSSPGRIGITSAPTEFDLIRHSLVRGTGLLDALFLPIADLVCPTNELSGTGRFPHGGSRSFDESCRPGHESVGVLVAIAPQGLERIRERGFDLGRLGVVNINLGCGRCAPCRRGGSPDVCANGQTYVGLGDGKSGADRRERDSWVYAESGRFELPGFLSERAVPVSSGSFFPLPLAASDGRRGEIHAFALADAVGCARNAFDGLAMATDHPRYHGSDDPEVLLIGCGKLGFLFALVCTDLMPRARLTAVDVKRGNLDLLTAARPDSNAVHVGGLDEEEVLRRLTELAASRNHGGFHYIMLAATHERYADTASRRALVRMLAPRGRTARMDHVSTDWSAGGGDEELAKQITHVPVLGPADNFGYAVALIDRHRARLAETIDTIHDPFGRNLAEFVEATETSARRRKRTSDAISTCIALRDTRSVSALVPPRSRHEIEL